MGDSLFNIIIVLIPVAIFIGRIVMQAKAKRKPEPPRKQPPIPVHFEDYDDEDDRQFAPSAVSKQAVNKAINNKDRAAAYSPPPLVDSAPIPPPLKKAKASSAEPEQGFLYLSHLSPMKQAVVMAEILGPPKGLQ
jgi:hypothetical protein